MVVDLGDGIVTDRDAGQQEQQDDAGEAKEQQTWLKPPPLAPKGMGIETSQLFLRSKDGSDKSARVYLGRGRNSYSVGMNAKGEFSIAFGDPLAEGAKGNGGQVHDILVATDKAVSVSSLFAHTVSAQQLRVNNVPQWSLVFQDLYGIGTGATHGWAGAKPMSCAGLHLAALDDSHPVMTKAFHHLPPHTQVRLVATAHFIDDWQGETAFLKVNDHYVWTDSHELRNGAKAINLCGSPLYPESRFSVTIDVSFHSTAESFTLAFGSNMESGSQAQLGVSSVAVYIREP